jgi:hypothetical protein
MCDVIESDGSISFEHTIPSTSLKKLYVRESYRTIASSINPGLNKAIITGTTGIGKSLFLIYLLWKLVKEGKRVLFIYHPYTIYYDGNGGVFELLKIPSPIVFSFWNDRLWCLFDTRAQRNGLLDEFPYDMCTFIVSTYPRRELVKDFKKPPVPQVFYLPTWTEAELKVIAPSFPAVTNWKKRFHILGGIPRHVLEVTTEKPIELLRLVCGGWDLYHCINRIDLNSTVTEHYVAHITSTFPFTECSLSYASKTALDIIVEKKGYDVKLKMPQLLQSCEVNPLIAALCGRIFETHAIDLLEKGGAFKCRELVCGNKRINPDETTVDIPPSIKKFKDKVVPNQARNKLYVPKTTNYAAIDAWIPGIGAFQMTVGKKHDIKCGARNDLAMLGHGAKKLYWLLPPLYYHSFTKKSPEDIEQHAILIPYP